MSHLNANLARRWFEEVWNQRKPNAIHEMLAPGCIGHLEGRRICGPDEFQAVQSEFLAAFPNIRFEIKNVVADADVAAIRWAAAGCHTGEAFGLKATRCDVKFYGTTWLRYQDGKIIEGWDTWNLGELMGKLRSQENGN